MKSFGTTSIFTVVVETIHDYFGMFGTTAAPSKGIFTYGGDVDKSCGSIVVAVCWAAALMSVSMGTCLLVVT